MRHLQTLTLCLLLAAMCGGCIQRTITVTSEPTAALVYLNDEEVGRTPVTVPFTFYGIYDVRLEADGYEPLWTKQPTKTPWWDLLGPDLFAEAIPNAKAKQEWHFVLQAAPKPSEVKVEPLLNRAHNLRSSPHVR